MQTTEETEEIGGRELTEMKRKGMDVVTSKREINIVVFSREILLCVIWADMRDPMMSKLYFTSLRGDGYWPGTQKKSEW